MPIYLYKNPETEEVVEVVQKMSEPHTFFKDGVKWDRVFTKPNASIDTKINPFSQQEYVEKTYNKKGTVGDLLDLSKELSQERKSKEGEDKVKRKYFDDYKNKMGIKHMNDKPEKIQKNGICVEL